MRRKTPWWVACLHANALAVGHAKKPNLACACVFGVVHRGIHFPYHFGDTCSWASFQPDAGNVTWAIFVGDYERFVWLGLTAVFARIVKGVVFCIPHHHWESVERGDTVCKVQLSRLVRLSTKLGY